MDVAELSFAKFCAQVLRKDSDIIGLPVICSRLFRVRYLCTGSPWNRPRESIAAGCCAVECCM